MALASKKQTLESVWYRGVSDGAGRGEPASKKQTLESVWYVVSVANPQRAAAASKKQTLESVWYAQGVSGLVGLVGGLKEADARKRLVLGARAQR